MENVRLVMVLTILIFLVGTICSATAKPFNSLLGSRILASIGSGLVESLGPNIIGGELNLGHEEGYLRAELKSHV
jgi:predicted MFS family arabinose efflux permease